MSARVEAGISKWLDSSNQFASIASGGIKWNKAEVVQEAYALYRDDETLSLDAFVAIKSDGTLVDTWQRSDDLAADVKALSDSLAADLPKAETAFVAEMTGDHAVVVSPAPKDKKGETPGVTLTLWSKKAINAEARQEALELLLGQALIIALLVGAAIYSMHRWIALPLRRLTASIEELRAGNLEASLPMLKSRHEISVVSRA